MSEDMEAVAEILIDAPDSGYTSMQIGLIMLREGTVDVDRCRDRAVPNRSRMPHASGRRMVEYGAQSVAVDALVRLRKTGAVKKTGSRPALYYMTKSGRQQWEKRGKS